MVFERNLSSTIHLKGHTDLRLYGEVIFTKALGESGDASKIGSSWHCSEFCFWVGLLAWPWLGAGPVALGGGDGPWFTVGLQAVEALGAGTALGLLDEAALDVVCWWAGAAGSAAGVDHVEVWPRLTEPDFTRKEPALSWDAALMERDAQRFMSIFILTVLRVLRDYMEQYVYHYCCSGDYLSLSKRIHCEF